MRNEVLELAQVLHRLNRRCERMNSGLSAVALVLMVVTLFMSGLRLSETINWSGKIGTLPYLLMSTDTPDVTGAPPTDTQLLGD